MWKVKGIGPLVRRTANPKWAALLLFGLCLQVLAVVCVVQYRNITKADCVLRWDFSKDARLSNITQPLGWSFNTASIDGPGRLVLDLEDGLGGETDFWLLQVWRDPDRKNRVRSLVILLQPQSQKDAAKSAMELAQKWRIANTKPIEDFGSRPDNWMSGGSVRAFTAEVDHRGKFIDPQSARVFIEIRGTPSPGIEKPYNVKLMIPIKDRESVLTTSTSPR